MKPLQILLLEDNEDDALLLARELRDVGCLAEVERVHTESGFCEALARDGWDAVIADFNVPGYGARAALRTVRERGIDLPFIIVSGVVGEENAVGAMKAGAHDFILKEQLSRLVPAIERELGEAANRHARRQAEQDLREAHALLEGRVAERTAELQQANERLEQESAERQRLETKIAEIGEAERRNIRHELHDGLCQELAGIGFMSNVLARNLAAADRSEAKEAQAVSDLVHDTLTRTRKLARGISPVEASEEGLMGALGELASTTRRIYGIECRFECPHPVLIKNNNAAGHLYRIAQEAIHNALENGKAGVVRIALEPVRSGARLSIQDNGVGLIEKDRDHPGIGIRVMRHRATSIGAELEIRPAEGGGTSVVCAWKKKL